MPASKHSRWGRGREGRVLKKGREGEVKSDKTRGRSSFSLYLLHSLCPSLSLSKCKRYGGLWGKAISDERPDAQMNGRGQQFDGGSWDASTKRGAAGRALCCITLLVSSLFWTLLISSLFWTLRPRWPRRGTEQQECLGGEAVTRRKEHDAVADEMDEECREK